MKKTTQSKTMWLNGIVLALSVAELIEPNILTALGVPPSGHERVLTLVGVGVAIANIYLRSITTTSVEMPKMKK